MATRPAHLTRGRVEAPVDMLYERSDVPEGMTLTDWRTLVRPRLTRRRRLWRSLR